jgi:hypothetical protein
MTPSLRLRVLTSLLVAAALLAPAGPLLLHDLLNPAHAREFQYPTVPDQSVDLSGLEEQFFPGDPGAYSPRTRKARQKSTPKKTRRAAGKGAGSPTEKSDTPTTAKKDGEKAGSPGAGSISFKQDVAPILVANCVGCHSQGRPGLSRGKLELTSFAKLMQGTPKEKVITPGKPDVSHLVLRVRGEESPRMPQGGNNNGLAEEAISRIEQWIKEGAKLDAGVDPKAAMESYASSPDQIRRNLLAKMSTREREQLVEKAGRDRWKKANPKLTPEITSGEHFVVFSNLPKDRATNAVKLMEAQHGNLKRLLGGGATSWAEKVSVYIFNARKDFVELARSVENRELDAEVSSTGNLTAAQPYIAVVDPLGGKKEEPAAARRKPRGKRADEKDAEASARTLHGLLADSLGEATVLSYGKSPRWLAYGLGAYLGALAEPRSPYYRKLRQLAHQKYDQGWITRATDVLGETDQVSAEEMRGMGLAFVESLLAPDLRVSFPLFAKGMSQGKEKLDDVLKEVYGVSREDFLNSTGDWVARQYGQGE